MRHPGKDMGCMEEHHKQRGETAQGLQLVKL
jgi:hypothetical protein